MNYGRDKHPRGKTYTSLSTDVKFYWLVSVPRLFIQEIVVYLRQQVSTRRACAIQPGFKFIQQKYTRVGLIDSIYITIFFYEWTFRHILPRRIFRILSMNFNEK